jgi:ribonuclease P protein component
LLPSEERLRRDRDFKRVYAAKRAIVHPLMVLYTRPSREGRRIGFSVSKKMGDAVRRNRIKRRLREACRAHRPVLKSGFDAIFVARSKLGAATYEEIVRTVIDLFRRAGLTERPARAERADADQGGRNGRSDESVDQRISNDRADQP